MKKYPSELKVGDNVTFLQNYYSIYKENDIAKITEVNKGIVRVGDCAIPVERLHDYVQYQCEDGTWDDIYPIKTLRYHEIRKDDTLNGCGVRTVLFVSGCNHRCPGCHNPQTWSFESGIEFNYSAYTKLINLSSRDYISGITFSGGDPLHPANINSVINIAADYKRLYPEKNVWVYTGYLYEEIPEWAFEYIDVLVDGMFEKDKEDVKYSFAGSTNQRVIDVQKSIKSKEVILCDLDRI
jgi:anaerobic ribonucleoside-triphosphate reductase activating protein